MWPIPDQETTLRGISANAINSSTSCVTTIKTRGGAPLIRSKSKSRLAAPLQQPDKVNVVFPVRKKWFIILFVVSHNKLFFRVKSPRCSVVSEPAWLFAAAANVHNLYQTPRSLQTTKCVTYFRDTVAVEQRFNASQNCKRWMNESGAFHRQYIDIYLFPCFPLNNV